MIETCGYCGGTGRVLAVDCESEVECSVCQGSGELEFEDDEEGDEGW